MTRFSFLSWCLAGFLSGLVGWLIGSLIGSFFPQIAGAVASTGAALGFMSSGKTRQVLLPAAAAFLVAGAAFMIGRETVTPLVAWPAGAVALGVFAGTVLRGRAARVATVLAAPVLGAAGFGLGAVIVVVCGLALSDSRVVAHFMVGGAAGFGLLTMSGIRVIAGSLDRRAAAEG